MHGKRLARACETSVAGLRSGVLRRYSWLVLLDAEGEPVFTAPPEGYPGRGDGWDWEKVFGGV